MSPGKSHSFPGMPICLVFGLASQSCPDLPISTAVCLCISGQKLAQILPVHTKNRWRPRLCPDPTGELMTLPQTLKSDPRWLAPVVAPYDSHLRRSSRTAVPKSRSPCNWNTFVLQTGCSSCCGSNRVKVMKVI